MPERRRKTLQELLANIAGGALAPATRVMSGYGSDNPFYSPLPVVPGKVPQEYSPSLLTPYQAKLEEDRLGAIDPTKPYGPQDDSVYEQDRVPRYSAVVDPRTLEQVSPGLNPYVFSQMTGKPSRTDYDDYIELLTARHPDFASEFRTDPIAAIAKYETSSGLSPNLSQAQQYHAGTLTDEAPGYLAGIPLLTPQMMEQAYPMLANFPGMRPMTFAIPDVAPMAGPMLPTMPPGGLLTADPLADPLGIGPLGSGGLLGQV